MSTATTNEEVQRAKQHLREGHAAEAVQELRTYLERDTSNPEAYEIMGAALTMAGNPDGGLACLQHAVEMEPQHASYQFNLACALEQRHDLMGALEHYRDAYHADPNYTRAIDS